MMQFCVYPLRCQKCDEMPLALIQANPVSGILRYTNVFGPVALSSSVAASLPQNARYMPTMEMILQFERSSRWPNDSRRYTR